MTLRRLLTQTATVVSNPVGPGVDEYGNLVEGTETRIAYRARLEPTGGDELTLDRATVVADWRLFLPPEAVITAYDRVEIEGDTFEVVGPPARHRTPRGVHHIEAKLRVVDR